MPDADRAAAVAPIVVGIGTYNNAGTIAAIARAVRDGLCRDFSVRDSRIVLADGGSTDGTPDLVREALGDAAGRLVQVGYPLHPVDLFDAPYHGLPGRGRALAAILGAARELGAQVCTVLDANAEGLAPGWLAALIRPVLDDAFDFVAPYYARAPHEGALTRSIVYPVFRALYGVRIRQPMAGDFSCSGRLVEHFLGQEGWQDGARAVGVDIWTTTAAVCGGFRLCEVALGARRHETRGDAPDLSMTIVQVVGALFAGAERRAEFWQRVRGSSAVPVFGQPTEAGDGSPIEIGRLIEAFRLGHRELRDVWAAVLPPATGVALNRLAQADRPSFAMDDDLWARIIYDFAIGHRLRVLPADHLLRALTPLYLGWLAAFLEQAGTAGAAAVEERIERLSLAFERQKPYLISRWRWPERFNA
ncbi:MAG TPA: hypothetical protein VNE16_03960 [Vicinamibacterales bacterium]|nr:hypothetical protein [Vicinamibacterales bacterium]